VVHGLMIGKEGQSPPLIAAATAWFTPFARWLRAVEQPSNRPGGPRQEHAGILRDFPGVFLSLRSLRVRRQGPLATAPWRGFLKTKASNDKNARGGDSRALSWLFWPPSENHRGVFMLLQNGSDPERLFRSIRILVRSSGSARARRAGSHWFPSPEIS